MQEIIQWRIKIVSTIRSVHTPFLYWRNTCRFSASFDSLHIYCQICVGLNPYSILLEIGKMHACNLCFWIWNFHNYNRFLYIIICYLTKFIYTTCSSASSIVLLGFYSAVFLTTPLVVSIHIFLNKRWSVQKLRLFSHVCHNCEFWYFIHMILLVPV